MGWHACGHYWDLRWWETEWSALNSGLNKAHSFTETWDWGRWGGVPMNFIETCDCERQGGVPSERQSGVPMSFIETCDCGRQGGVPMTRMSFIETWDCGVRDGVECLMTDGKEHTGTWDCERQYGVSMGFCERHYRVPMGFIETRDCERWGVVPTDRWRRVYVRLWEDGVPIGFIETWDCDRDGVDCLWALLWPETERRGEVPMGFTETQDSTTNWTDRMTVFFKFMYFFQTWTWKMHHYNEKTMTFTLLQFRSEVIHYALVDWTQSKLKGD